MNRKDYYEILEIDCKADVGEVKQAYRKLAFQYHPDRNSGNPDSLDRMKEINEAYAVLCDPEKRSRYDSLRQNYGASAQDRFRQGYSQEDIFRGSDINQIFEEMAKSFGFRGFDEVFQQAYGKGARTFEFRQPGFYGKGFIIFGGGSMGRGRQGPTIGAPVFPGLMGKVAGFLVRNIFNLPQPQGGKDAQDVISIDCDQAEKGGKVLYLDRNRSKEVAISIPPGIREGQRIRLKGMGQGSDDEGEKGDLYLKVEIKKPILQRVINFLKR
jgi:DnaJ-class molecular chaperone